MKALIYLAIGAFLGWHAHRATTAIGGVFIDTDDPDLHPIMVPELPATRITRPGTMPQVETLSPTPAKLIRPGFTIGR